MFVELTRDPDSLERAKWDRAAIAALPVIFVRSVGLVRDFHTLSTRPSPQPRLSSATTEPGLIDDHQGRILKSCRSSRCVRLAGS